MAATTHSTITEETVSVSSAVPHQLRAAQLLLPAMTSAGLVTSPLIATLGSRIVGAAVVATDMPARIDGRCPAEVEVIAGFRGRGIEKALWLRLIADANAAGGGVLCQPWFAQDVVPPAGWDLQVIQTRYEFTGPLASAASGLTPLYERLVRHRRVPANAEIVPLCRADVAGIAAIYQQHFPGTLRQVEAMCRGGPPSHFDLDLSFATMIDGRITSFMLGRCYREQSLFDIYWKAVDVRYRNGWSNAMLMYYTTVRLIDAGFSTVRYRAMTHNRDTRQLVGHIGTEITRIEVRYGTAVPAAN